VVSKTCFYCSTQRARLSPLWRIHRVTGDNRVAYDLTGKIKLIQEAKTFDSGFTKREMVVTVEDGKYPQDINIEFVQDKVALLDALQPGQEVTVSFDIRGREYNGRYFNNLQGWKVVAQSGDQKPAEQGQPPAPPYATPSDFDDDIPF
jgi:hypothetical protein